MLRLAAVMAAAALIAAPLARAEEASGVGSEYRVNGEALFGADAAARDAELARFVAEADSQHPFVFVHFARALFEAGRPDEARAWYMRGYVRLWVDVRFLDAATHASGLGDFPYFYQLNAAESAAFANFIDGAGARERAAAYEDAIAWELATPRHYDMVTGPMAHSLEAYMAALAGERFIADLPADARRLFAEAQAALISEVRASMANLLAAQEILDEADAAIAAHRPAREAVDAVDEKDRARLTPLRSVRLPCAEPAFVAGQAVAAHARRAAIRCAGAEPSFAIVDLADGRALASASAQPFADGAFAFARGADVTLLARRNYPYPEDPPGIAASADAPLFALRAGRDIAPLALPLPPGVSSAKHAASTYDIAASPSGRYAYVQFGAEFVPDEPNWQVEAVYDVARARLLWSEAHASPPEGQTERSRRSPAFIDDIGPTLVAQRRSVDDSSFLRPAAIERIDLRSGALRNLAWPAAAADAAPQPYGPGQALLSLDPPPFRDPPAESAYAGADAWGEALDAYNAERQAHEAASPQYALIDLAALTETWRGRGADLPALPAPKAECDLLTYDIGEGVERNLWTLNREGEAPIVLMPARERALTQCVVSPDRRRIALLVAPFVHIYRIDW